MDTAVVSFLSKNHPISSQYDAALEGRTQVVSFMTLAELERWVMQANWGEARRNRLREYREPFLVLPFNRALCTEWAKVTVAAQTNGRRAATALLYGLPQRQRRPADSSGRQRHVPQPVFWERVHRTIPLAEHGEMQCTATIKAAAILGAGAAFLTHPDAGVPSGARTLAQGSPERLYGRPRRHLLRRPCRQWQDLPPHAVAGLATGALGSEDAVAFLVPYLSIRTQVADTRRLARSYRGKCQRLAFPVNLPILATSCLMRDPAYGRRRIPSEWLSATLISLARVNGNVRAP